MSAPMALNAPQHRAGMGNRVLAGLCIWLATALLRLRFGRVLAVARWAKRRCARPATATEAAGATAAVQVAARNRAGRVACLEQSLATVLMAALRLRSVDWCIGARLMPYASHAWIEVDGDPIGEPSTQDRPYHLLLRV